MFTEFWNVAEFWSVTKIQEYHLDPLLLRILKNPRISLEFWKV